MHHYTGYGVGGSDLVLGAREREVLVLLKPGLYYEREARMKWMDGVRIRIYGYQGGTVRLDSGEGGVRLRVIRTGRAAVRICPSSTWNHDCCLCNHTWGDELFLSPLVRRPRTCGING